MYKIICKCFCLLMLLSVNTWAQKSVYIPNEHKAGINNCSSTYCMARSYQTENFLFLWQATYTNPDLTAMNACERVYKYYVETMKFASVNPAANIYKYKFVIMIDPSLTGVAYGSGVDDVIGAMWVGPGTLGSFVFGHELGHAFSYQTRVDGTYKYGFSDQPGTNGSRIYCGPFWETVANFMSYQFADFQGGTTRDLGLYMRCYNYFFTHARSRYEGWPMLEALKSELGVEYMGKTWLESKDPEHPVETVKRIFSNNSQAQVNDLFGKCAMRLVKWDIAEPLGGKMRSAINANQSDYLPIKFQTLLRPVNVSKGRYAVADNFAPQEYGYNVIKLFPQRDNTGKAIVYVHFRGMKANDNAGWRYGFVAVSTTGTSRYSSVYANDKGIVSMDVTSSDQELYLVVMGAPTRHTNYSWEIGFPKVYRYRYELALKNAVPEGYEPSFRKPATVTGGTHSNGGGFIASTASVASSVYVSPNAKVLGNARITGNVRIEDWAVVTGNAILSGSVIIRGHALVGESITISENAVIADEARVFGSGTIRVTAQVLDGATVTGGTINGSAIVKGNAFEWGQTIGGTAVMGGDNENTSATAGVYLQMPDSNNGRVAGDGKGASDPSNVDINTIAVSYATDAEMDIPTVPATPVAAFSGSPTSITAGGTVTFTDQSTNTPTAWAWNFGDGLTSSVASPSHVYTNAGTYTVSLTVTNASGTNTVTKTSYITVTTGGESGSVLPRTGWGIKYYSSQETSGESAPATNVLDGSTSTFWHTQWSGTAPGYPHEIQLDMKANYSVTGLKYLPRQGTSINGRIGGYQLYVSTDGTTWGATVASGTWNSDATEKTVTFTSKTGRYVRLVAISPAVSGQAWASVAEINVIGSGNVTATNIAPLATPSTSYVSPWETLAAINDGFTPTSSNDVSHGAYGNWNNPNTIEWVQYDWNTGYSISQLELYWFDDAGGVLTPTTAYAEYWNGSAWVNLGNVPLVKNTFNSLSFNSVTASRVRVSIRNSTQSTGILEWRVFTSTTPSARVVADQPTITAVEEESVYRYSIFPNPLSAGEDITIVTPGNNESQVFIHDSFGRQIYTTTFFKYVKVSRSTLGNGKFFIVRILGDKKLHVEKIIAR